MYQLHKKLTHLSKAEIEELVLGYIGDENLSSLIIRFNIDCKPNQIYEILPPIFLEKNNCPNCGEPMATNRPRRKSRFSNKQIYCPSCNHNLSDHCDCSYCRRIVQQFKESQANRKKQLIAEFCKQENPGVINSIDVEALSFKAVVGFLALVRSCGYSAQNENFELNEIEQSTFPFAPHGMYVYDVLIELISEGLIAVCEESDSDSFIFEEDRIIKYHPLKVRWITRLESATDLVQEIESRARNHNWPSTWIDQVQKLWFELAIAESMEFFRYMGISRGFPESGERATFEMIRNLLNSYSVAQAMYIIYKGAKDAADFKVRKGCTLQHASNYMIGACQRYGDKAIAENWSISVLRRNYDLPQSTLSSILHDVFLQHGEKGFLECPHEWK